MKQRFLSWVLSAVLLISLLSAFAFSVSAETEGVFTYTVEDEKATIVQCDRAVTGELEIPAELGGYPVVELSVCAFQNCKELTAVKIPESVIYIGDWVFQNCEKLAVIDLPSSLSVLGCDAFKNTAFYNDEENWTDGVLYLETYLLRVALDYEGALAVKDGTTHIADFGCDFSEMGESMVTAISLPDSLKNIGCYAFWFCGMSEINLPEGLERIGDGAFMNCTNLTAVSIPSTVQTIGELNFQWCGSLTAIHVSEENAFFSSWEDALYNKDQTRLIKCPETKETLRIAKGVTALEGKPFRGCRSLRTVIIPKSVTVISENLFPHSEQLEAVYYLGSEADRALMEIHEENVNLFCAAWYSMFADLTDSHWAFESIFYCYQNGIMSGVQDGTNFNPSGTMTRAALVSTLYRLEGSPEVSGSAGFTDVAEGAWYADAVTWASQEGIVSGKDDGTFAPTDPVTRMSFVSILYRYAEYSGEDVSARADLSGFADAGSVPNWARANIEWAVAEGLLSGTTSGNKVNINYSGKATRAQGAVLLQKFCEM